MGQGQQLGTGWACTRRALRRPSPSLGPANSLLLSLRSITGAPASWAGARGVHPAAGNPRRPARWALARPGASSAGLAHY